MIQTIILFLIGYITSSNRDFTAFMNADFSFIKFNICGMEVIQGEGYRLDIFVINLGKKTPNQIETQPLFAINPENFSGDLKLGKNTGDILYSLILPPRSITKHTVYILQQSYEELRKLGETKNVHEKTDEEFSRFVAALRNVRIKTKPITTLVSAHTSQVITSKQYQVPTLIDISFQLSTVEGLEGLYEVDLAMGGQGRGNGSETIKLYLVQKEDTLSNGRPSGLYFEIYGNNLTKILEQPIDLLLKQPVRMH